MGTALPEAHTQGEAGAQEVGIARCCTESGARRAGCTAAGTGTEAGQGRGTLSVALPASPSAQTQPWRYQRMHARTSARARWQQSLSRAGSGAYTGRLLCAGATLLMTALKAGRSSTRLRKGMRLHAGTGEWVGGLVGHGTGW